MRTPDTNLCTQQDDAAPVVGGNQYEVVGSGDFGLFVGSYADCRQYIANGGYPLAGCSIKELY